MNTIIAIFRRDVGKLLSRPTACIIMIGLIIIPSLYAWFNIAANWDPYSNTKNIAIGVANNDTGTVLSGASLNVGDKVVQELRANDAMDWTFVSEQEALEGVRSGRFYAAVVIPRDFSQNMASITTGTITKPQLHYYLNEKTNAIANKMTNVGVDTVQNKVNQAFVETVTLVAGQLLNISADKLNQAGPHRQPHQGHGRSQYLPGPAEDHPGRRPERGNRRQTAGLRHPDPAARRPGPGTGHPGPGSGRAEFTVQRPGHGHPA